VPALAAAAVGVLLAAIALVRSGDPELSTVYIRTRPAGAEVFLRGQAIGFAPLKHERLPSGDATVELRAPGFQTATRAIRLEPGKVLLLDVDLVRHVAPVAAPTTPAAQQADLQAQLAAARQVERRAGPAEVNHDGDREPLDHDTQRRRASGRRTDSDPEGAEPRAEAAPVTETATVAKADVQLEPRPEITAAAAPDAMQQAVPAPPQAAPIVRAEQAKPSSGITRPAALMKQSTPRFPARAKRMGISRGTVTIEFTIDRNGAVKNASVAKADPPGLFDETALREIQKWKYRPKLENGTAVETRQRFTFRFSD
jgi:TonB family protein